MIYSGPILSGNMYFRIAHRESNGRDYDYLQLVEAYREEGKNRQRVLLLSLIHISEPTRPY